MVWQGGAGGIQTAQTLSRELDLSLRQAYRYLEHASELDHPVPIEEASIPITLKLPPSTVRLLRASAARSGLTLERSSRVR